MSLACKTVEDKPAKWQNGMYISDGNGVNQEFFGHQANCCGQWGPMVLYARCWTSLENVRE